MTSAASLLFAFWEAAVALSAASAIAHVLPSRCSASNFDQCGISAAHNAELMQAERPSL